MQSFLFLADYHAIGGEAQAVARSTLEIAASWPDAKYWAMEVRAVMGSSGDEM